MTNWNFADVWELAAELRGDARALVHGDQKIICFDGNGYCKLFDLAADPLEKSPITRGDAYKEMKARFLDYEKGVHEVAPYACTGDCLNSTARRMKEQGGQ